MFMALKSIARRWRIWVVLPSMLQSPLRLGLKGELQYMQAGGSVGSCDY